MHLHTSSVAWRWSRQGSPPTRTHLTLCIHCGCGSDGGHALTLAQNGGRKPGEPSLGPAAVSEQCRRRLGRVLGQLPSLLSDRPHAWGARTTSQSPPLLPLQSPCPSAAWRGSHSKQVMLTFWDSEEQPALPAITGPSSHLHPSSWRPCFRGPTGAADGQTAG